MGHFINLLPILYIAPSKEKNSGICNKSFAILNAMRNNLFPVLSEMWERDIRRGKGGLLKVWKVGKKKSTSYTYKCHLKSVVWAVWYISRLVPMKVTYIIYTNTLTFQLNVVVLNAKKDFKFI